MLKKSLSVLILTCLVIPLCYSQEEKLTITTYYPSPYGSYSELRSKRVAIGENYISGDYCWGSGCGSNVISDDADLVVEGRVGIGTVSVQRALEIKGTYPPAQVAISNPSSNIKTYLVAGTGSGGIASNYNYNYQLDDRDFSGWDLLLSPQQDHAVMYRIPPGDNPRNINAWQELTYWDGATGNVGIGTDNPSAKLHIDSKGTVSAPVDAIRIVDGRQGDGKVLTSDADGVGTWQDASGGVSYTHYCYVGAAYGTPQCPATVTIGQQGPCDTGFTVRKALGGWGFCRNYGYNAYFRPPGASCGSAVLQQAIIGQAYVCSK